MVNKIEMGELEDLLTQLVTLNNDYNEIRSMDRNTAVVEEEIQKRMVDLKDFSCDIIENALDIPVILDGELLIYEKSVKKRKVVRYDKLSKNAIDNLDIKNDSANDYYFYMEKEIYRLDVEEENLMNVIRFVNFKKEFPIDRLATAIASLKKVLKTSFGYRLSLATINKGLEVVENISIGTVFNNSNYSRKSFDLLEKLMLKLKDDYIERVGSPYSTLDYEIHSVENRQLIINIKNGSTDIMTEEESQICKVAFDVMACFDGSNILANNRKTDERIEKLQAVVIHYLENRKK